MHASSSWGLERNSAERNSNVFRMKKLLSNEKFDKLINR